MKNERLISRNKFINRIDPIYLFFDRFLFKSLFQPPKASDPNQFEIIEESQIDFLVQNMKKHRVILWINIFIAIFLSVYGLEIILKTGDAGIVVTGLLAPAMITGAAWFAISFGGIPEKFISIAFTLTLCMYLSFTLSMTILTCLLVAITPWSIGVLIIIPIYITLYIASMLYDNVDGLKIGLDSSLLKMSRASINYYRKHGLVTQAETEKETFGSDAPINSGQIALFTYYINNLRRNLDQLEENKNLGIANHLIASSADILYNIIEISYQSQNKKVDRGGEIFKEFVLKAHEMSQAEADAQAINSLRNIVSLLKQQLDNVTGNELDEIENKLSNYYKSFETQDDDINKQQLGDLIFSQTFRKLLELVSAFRPFLFGTEEIEKK